MWWIKGEKGFGLPLSSIHIYRFVCVQYGHSLLMLATYRIIYEFQASTYVGMPVKLGVSDLPV